MASVSTAPHEAGFTMSQGWKRARSFCGADENCVSARRSRPSWQVNWPDKGRASSKILPPAHGPKQLDRPEPPAARRRDRQLVDAGDQRGIGRALAHVVIVVQPLHIDTADPVRAYKK